MDIKDAKFTGSAAPVLVFEGWDHIVDRFQCFFLPTAGLFLWQIRAHGDCYECGENEDLKEFGAGSRTEALDALRSLLRDDPKLDWGRAPDYVREAAEAVHHFSPPVTPVPETPADEAAAARAFVEILTRMDEVDAAKAKQEAEWEALGEAERARQLAAETQAFRDAMVLPWELVTTDAAPSPETPAPPVNDPVPSVHAGNSVRILPATDFPLLD